MTLNPNAPTVKGMEWWPTRQRGFRVSPSQRMAVTFTPDAGYTADDVVLRLVNVLDDPVVHVDVETVASVVTDAVVTSNVYRPNGDGGSADIADLGNSTVPPLYTEVDESVLDATDGLKTPTGGTAATKAFFEYGSAGFTGRPLSVVVHGEFRQPNECVGCAAQVKYELIPTIVIGGVEYAGDTQFIEWTTNDPTAHFPYEWEFPVNPATGGEWTAAEIQAFDAGAYAGWKWGPASGAVQLLQSWIVVDAVPETRLAQGSLVVSADGEVTVPLATPAGVDTFALTNAVPTQMVVSVVSASGSASVRALDSGEAHPLGIGSQAMTVDVNDLPTVPGDADTAAPTFAFLSAVGVPLYGQAYHAIDEEEVHTGRTVEQEVTFSTLTSRGWMAFVAKQASKATVEDLTVRVKRRSNDVQVGGDLTVMPFDLRDSPRLFRKVTDWMATGAAPVVAVQHYIQFSSAAADGSGWVVPVLRSSAALAALGYGGTIDAATVAGVEDTATDVAVVVGTTRTAGTGLAAVAQT